MLKNRKNNHIKMFCEGIQIENKEYDYVIMLIRDLLVCSSIFQAIIYECEYIYVTPTDFTLDVLVFPPSLLYAYSNFYRCPLVRCIEAEVLSTGWIPVGGC